MSDQKIQALRDQLRASRRKHNTLLVIGQLGYWLAAVLATFIVFTLLSSIFKLQGLALQLVFSAWVCAIFAISFTCFWRFSVQLQTDNRFAHNLEKRLPDLEQRVITSLEFDEAKLEQDGMAPRGVSPQFIQQLWQDAQNHVETTPLNDRRISSGTRRSVVIASIAGLSLIALLFGSDSFLRAGREMLWPFTLPEIAAEAEKTPLPVAINVEPGDISLQRGDDLTVIATLDNATASELSLYIQDDHVNWQRLTVLPQGDKAKGDANVFAIDLHQLSQDAVYYVEYSNLDIADSEPVRSPQYKISLFDLPRVENLTLTYEFPAYTGMENRVENPGGDIVAPEGTKITLAAELNKAVNIAKILFDDGTALDLTLDGKTGEATFTVVDNTQYHFELLDDKKFKNKDPLDYYVRAIKDQPPEIALKYPGKDQEVMPLEEIEIEVDAKDDYGLTQFELMYSVIGVDEKKVDFLGKKKTQSLKSTSGSSLLYLEDLNVQPGDVVSYSIAVADNNGLNGPHQIISDIYFLEVMSPDQEFSRARGGGGGGAGGGGGGGDGNALIKNQKDVISATWKLRNREDKVAQKDFSADAAIIRDSQSEVAQRAQMSINRLTERGDFADDNYTKAVTYLQNSIVEMNTAADLLAEEDLVTALQHEQQALQSILRAESQINKTEISMNRNRGGGGGGGGNRERDDLRELFEMELGELENRYELPQQGGGQQGGAQARNELLDKLEELARRQERLTRSQRELARRENQMTEEQKRQQLEQLRRQQEQLQQQLQQLAQQSAQQQSAQQQSSQQQSAQQQSSQQQSSQQQSSSSSSSSQSSSQERRQQQLADANRQLQQAMEQMRQAAESESPAQAAARSQKALDSLRQQVQQWSDQQNQSVAELQQAVKEQTDNLVRQQRQFREAVEELSRQQSLGDSRSQTASSEDTAELLRQQQAQQAALDEIGEKLREIATRAGEDERKAMEQAHELARELRPIRERMETSNQILERGMVNLSLKIENDIEASLNTLQAQVRGIGNNIGGSENQDRELANQIRQLRESLQQLENQAREFNEPDNLAVRRGERSGANQQQGNVQPGERGSEQVTRNDLQESLQRSRELAQGLVQLGRNSLGGTINGNARSIRSQLTQQSLEEFLNRPDLLKAVLNPVLEMEKQLRVQSELNVINERLYSQLDEDIPEQYKALVEQYYQGLSESQTPASDTR